jgi:hypothetical protein
MSEPLPREIPTDVAKWTSEQLTLVERALAIPAISSTAGAEQANAFLRTVKTAYAQIEAKRLEITRPMDTAKARVMDFFRAPLAKLTQAEEIVKRKLLVWQEALERERRRQEEEARRRAEVERERIRAEAARAEAAAAAARAKAAEEERKKREQAAAEQDAARRARLEEEAAAAREAGERKAVGFETVALERREVAQHVPTLAVAPLEAPAGFSARNVYKARVVNKLELVKAVAEGRAPATCVEPNQQALDGMARALKEGFVLPGCELEVKTTGVSR